MTRYTLRTATVRSVIFEVVIVLVKGKMVNVELGEFLLWFQDGRKGSVDKGEDGKKLKLSDVLLIVPALSCT